MEQNLAAYVVGVRRALHAVPELGLDNPVTQQRIIDELAAIPGLEVRRGSASTSVVARLRTGRAGSTMILRADTDALPVQEDSGVEYASRVDGVAHSCGHDAHVAMLLGAARLLDTSRDQLAGDVLFIFQTGEEGHDGARVLLADPVYADWFAGLNGGHVQAFAIHVTPNLPSGVIASRPGTLMASTDGLRAILHGRGGHAALPGLCVNPLPAAGELASRLSGDSFPGPDPLVAVTVLRGGTTHNVIPDTAEVTFTLRCLDEETRRKTREDITRELDHVVSGTEGLTAEMNSLVSYPCTVNDPEAIATARSAIAGVPGLSWRELPSPVMTAEDFSYLLQRWPGCMVLLGACPPDIAEPATAPPCHAPGMRIEESVLASGAALHAAVTTAVCSRN
jgi:amidohydrolase